MFTRVRSKLAVAVICLVALAHSCYADAPKLGLVINVEADGILNPVITKISVTKVEKASLAEAAGMVGGDEIVQIEGRPVAGSRAREMQALMKFNAGETRTLRVKHADGKQFDAKLTKPKE